MKRAKRLFCGVASVSKRRRGGFIGVPFKVGSREVYNYSTKTNFVGNDCSARASTPALRRAKSAFVFAVKSQSSPQ